MRFHARPKFRLGPFRWNFTEHGYSSWSVHLGVVTWNSRSRQWTVNTPGWGWVVLGRSRRR